MTAAEIAAYIGAAAWAPQIVRWVYRAYVTPQIQVIASQYASIGYTRLGPIFNLNLAFTAQRKPAVIDALEMVMTHQDGERHTFQMQGMSETISDIADPAGNKTVISKEQVTLAFRIPMETLLEKFVRFQEPRFHTELEPLTQKLAEQVKFEREKGDDYFLRIRGVKEFREILSFHQNYFWWKAGTYSVVFRMTSPERIKLQHTNFQLHVLQSDVESLQANTSHFQNEYENLIRGGEDGFALHEVNWNWRIAKIQRVEF
jgi:hypothetical protein